VTLPFSGMDIYIYSTNAALGSSLTYGDGQVSSTVGLDLSPYSSASHPACFGMSIAQLCINFAAYRFKRLKVTFVPMLPTSTAGVIAFGATADPLDLAPVNIQTVMSAGTNMMCSLWQDCTMDLTPIVTTRSRLPWYVTRNDSNLSTETRMTCPGSINGFCVAPTAFAAVGLLGFLRFEGVIEFTSLSRVDLLGCAGLQPLPPSNNITNNVNICLTENEEKSQYVHVPSNPTLGDTFNNNNSNNSSGTFNSSTINNSNVPYTPSPPPIRSLPDSSNQTFSSYTVPVSSLIGGAAIRR
jgi:hypothetical protein